MEEAGEAGNEGSIKVNGAVLGEPSTTHDSDGSEPNFFYRFLRIGWNILIYIYHTNINIYIYI